MSASSNQSASQLSDSPTTGGVRRHHTISAHSRSARASTRDVISEETFTPEQPQQNMWNDDEVVDEDWVGGVGAVGEKTSLHRQASLPTRYNRLQPKKSANQTINSLAAIDSNDGDEEPWKLASYNVEDDEHVSLESSPAHQQIVDSQVQPMNPPVSAPFTTNPPSVPSPPPAASGVRRHVSLTYGAAVGGQRKNSAGLKRSGTLQANATHAQQSPPPPETAEQLESENDPEDPSFYQEEYLRQQQQQYSNTNSNISSPWPSNNDWRSGYGGNGNAAIDDVQRALSALEMASNQNTLVASQNTYGQYQPSQGTAQPPRFNTVQQQQTTGPRGNGIYTNNNGNRGSEYDGKKTPNSQRGNYTQQQYGHQGDAGNSWNQKDPNLRGRASNPTLQYGQHQTIGNHTKTSSGSAVPSVPPIPPQYLQPGTQTNRQGLGISTAFGDIQVPTVPTGQAPSQPFLETPIDVPTLIAMKGYNPAHFDIRPSFARYFVIKSYTEDDVHKSLKYEIWSSTDPGNKRLDKAFKETASRGPIYLFFSVNASGHFCGMAEMLTPVDYTRSSTVWASDKWKGVFKVRWIFIRDIPNINLRHIKLMNTQEKKPVTNSRDTQELLPDAGQEMMRIFHTHPARTSLLQDFAFYELQAMQKAQATGNVGSSPPPVLSSPQLHGNALPNNNTPFNSYNIPPMMQMGIGVGGQYGGTQQGGLQPQSQAMHQSVMRQPSPGPQQQQQAQLQTATVQGNYISY